MKISEALAKHLSLGFMLFWDSGGILAGSQTSVELCQLGKGGGMYSLEAVMLYLEAHTSTFCKLFMYLDHLLS